VSNLLSAIITSKTRNHLFLRLFLNPQIRAYLRELAQETGSSTNAVREELNNLVAAKLLVNEKDGRKVLYRANNSHPLFPELQSMVRKVLGLDRLQSVIESVGNVELAMLLDDYACGKDTGIIDLLLVGDINQQRLGELVFHSQEYIKRKIRTLTLTTQEYEEMSPRLMERPHLLLWRQEKA
jgi:hypothetical protein